MTSKIWNEIQVGRNVIQIMTLDKERRTDAVALMYSFFRAENVSKSCEMTSNLTACEQFARLCHMAAEDGVSMIAVDKETDEVIGVAFNKIHKKSTKPNEPGFAEKFRNDYCTEENLRSFINCMIDLHSGNNFFELFNVDSFIELLCLSVPPEWRAKGIGLALLNGLQKFVKSLKGDANNRSVPRHIVVVATSKFTFNILQKLNFNVVKKKEFSDYTYNGKWKYSDKVDCNIHDQGLVLLAKEIIPTS